MNICATRVVTPNVMASLCEVGSTSWYIYTMRDNCTEICDQCDRNIYREDDVLHLLPGDVAVTVEVVQVEHPVILVIVSPVHQNTQVPYEILNSNVRKY